MTVDQRFGRASLGSDGWAGNFSCCNPTNSRLSSVKTVQKKWCMDLFTVLDGQRFLFPGGTDLFVNKQIKRGRKKEEENPLVKLTKKKKWQRDNMSAAL